MLINDETHAKALNTCSLDAVLLAPFIKAIIYYSFGRDLKWSRTQWLHYIADRLINEGRYSNNKGHKITQGDHSIQSFMALRQKSNRRNKTHLNHHLERI